MRKTFPLSPYPARLTFTDSRRTFSKLTGCEIAPEAVGMAAQVGGGYVLGWFDGEVHTLAHEATHVCLYLFEYVCIDPMQANGEPMAYMLGHIVRRVLAAKEK